MRRQLLLNRNRRTNITIMNTRTQKPSTTRKRLTLHSIRCNIISQSTTHSNTIRRTPRTLKIRIRIMRHRQAQVHISMNSHNISQVNQSRQRSQPRSLILRRSRINQHASRRHQYRRTTHKITNARFSRNHTTHTNLNRPNNRTLRLTLTNSTNMIQTIHKFKVNITRMITRHLSRDLSLQQQRRRMIQHSTNLPNIRPLTNHSPHSHNPSQVIQHSSHQQLTTGLRHRQHRILHHHHRRISTSLNQAYRRRIIRKRNQRNHHSINLSRRSNSLHFQRRQNRRLLRRHTNTQHILKKLRRRIITDNRHNHRQRRHRIRQMIPQQSSPSRTRQLMTSFNNHQPRRPINRPTLQPRPTPRLHTSIISLIRRNRTINRRQLIPQTTTRINVRHHSRIQRPHLRNLTRTTRINRTLLMIKGLHHVYLTRPHRRLPRIRNKNVSKLRLNIRQELHRSNSHRCTPTTQGQHHNSSHRSNT